MKSGMRNLANVLIALLICLNINTIQLSAQNRNLGLGKGNLETAIELYNNGAYKNAIAEFNKVIKQNAGKKNSALEKAEAYKVLCNIALDHSNVTSAVNVFQKKYPTSSYLARIRYEYANYLIGKEKFASAIKVYNSLNARQLSDAQKSTAKFNKAYALFKTDQQDEAEKLFSEIISDPKSTPSNVSAAKYYKGYTAYSQKNFKEAIPLLEESAKDVRFSQLSQYYILDSKFMLKDYDYVIRIGSKMVDENVKKYEEDSKTLQIIDIDDVLPEEIALPEDSLASEEEIQAKKLAEEQRAAEKAEKKKKAKELESRVQGNRLATGKMARLVAESFYQKNDLKQANKYFGIYSDFLDDLSREDRLFCGTLAYKTEDWENAAKNLSWACSPDDSLTQIASYSLAESYIKLKNKEEALKAFQKAAELTYDPQIQEDAAFNYAKLNFDLTGEVAPMEEYLQNHKVAQKKQDEIYGYIAANAIKNKDYDYALSALGKIKNKSHSDNINYQRANLFKGGALLGGGSHHLAYPYLQRAMAGESEQVRDMAKLLLSECWYRDEKYQESINALSSLKDDANFQKSSEYPMVFFNLGYNYFKMRNFQKAEECLEKYIELTQSGQNTHNPLAEEAKLRIADCRFLTKDYPTAIKMYKKIAGSSTAEPREMDMYPAIQLAIAYGLSGRNSDKISTLRHYTSTEYKYNKSYSEALYELSKAQVQNKEEGPAATTLLKLVYNPPDSLYYAQALLDIAMINTNRQSYDSAIEYCKKVLDYSPNSKEGEAALNTLENIYKAQDIPEEFYNFIQERGLGNDKTPEQREEFVYKAARNIYLTGKYESATKALASYLEEFPEGANNTEALYCIAESYKNLGNLKKAARYYDAVVENGYSPYFEAATLNYSDICFANAQYDEAINGFDKLEQNSRNASNKVLAVRGLLKSYYMNKDFDNAISKANQLYVLSMQNKLIKEKEEALYCKAKSLLAQGYIDEAEPVLQMVADNPNSDSGAEANYLLILKAFNRGRFDDVESLVFAFSDTKTEQTYWLAKSFIVLGDAYAEKGNRKQALATYESIRDNYEGKDDIIETVTEKIAQLDK